MLEDDIKLISLKGRMDIAGTQEIDTRLTVATASVTINVIMDLADVEFMTFIGIGVFGPGCQCPFKEKRKNGIYESSASCPFRS